MRASAGSQIGFVRLGSSSSQFSLFSQCAPCPHSHACPHIPCLALSTSSLATYLILRVLFSAGEGKRCWLLSRDAYVDMRDPTYCLLAPALSVGERDQKGKGDLRAPRNGPREWRLPSSLPLHQVPRRPLAQTSPGPCPVAGERGTSLHLKVI